MKPYSVRPYIRNRVVLFIKLVKFITSSSCSRVLERDLWASLCPTKFDILCCCALERETWIWIPLFELTSWPPCKIARKPFRSKVKVVKSAYDPNDPSGQGLHCIFGFYSMRRLRVFLLPPGWDASPSPRCPQDWNPLYLSIQYTFPWLEPAALDKTSALKLIEPWLLS